MQLFPDSPLIFHAHYMDEQKQRLRAIVRFPDGRFTEMEGNRSEETSAFIRDVFAQFTEAEIEANTARELALREAKEEIDRRAHEDREKEEARTALFRAKAQTLDIPDIKACADKELLVRIRKARSEAEVYTLAAMALLRAQSL